MPVKHAPTDPSAKVTFDGTCTTQGCAAPAMKGMLMCSDHEPTEPDAKPIFEESSEDEETE